MRVLCPCPVFRVHLSSGSHRLRDFLPQLVSIETDVKTLTRHLAQPAPSRVHEDGGPPCLVHMV